MTRRLLTPVWISSILSCLIFMSCSSENDLSRVDSIKVRLASEPDRLNPILTTSSLSIIVNNYIFMPLADFDPFSMELTPLLIESMPTEEIVEQGPFMRDYKYTYRIRDNATWSDGHPITSEDYLFTLKAATNPYVSAAAWRGFIREIRDVIINPDDPKEFSVIVESDYMLAKEITCTFQILPRHIYDQNNILNNYSLFELKIMDDTANDEKLKLFADEFSSAKFNRDIVIGSGPYKLDKWTTKQLIKLEKVKNWWGNEFKDIGAAFQNNPNNIEFVIIADEIVALTALKNDQIQVMSNVSPDQFISLKNDENYTEKLSFHTPALMRYYYFGMNTKSKVLSDKRVRRALVQVLDNKALINDIALGLAEPIVGPFNPSKSYYNDDLSILEKDMEMANKLVQESGWKDSNHNGTVDKVIDGKLEELEIDILVTNRPLGQKLALLLKENCKKIGIDINLIKKDFSLIRNDLKKGDFEMAALVAGQAPTPNDPYQVWHTDNIANGGNNYSGFGNDRSDELIEKIRTTKNLKARDEYYKELQEIIYEEQPYIFLYAPLERIITSNTFDIKTSSVRPGYFVNTFKKAS